MRGLGYGARIERGVSVVSSRLTGVPPVSSPLCGECTPAPLKAASAPRASWQVGGLYRAGPMATGRHPNQALCGTSLCEPSYVRSPYCAWESRRIGRMRARLGPQPPFINALYVIDPVRTRGWWVFDFHASTLHILIMTELFFSRPTMSLFS